MLSFQSKLSRAAAQLSPNLGAPSPWVLVERVKFAMAGSREEKFRSANTTPRRAKVKEHACCAEPGKLMFSQVMAEAQTRVNWVAMELL